MKFTCDSCSAQYMISDEKVGPSGVKVRCKKCGNVILVRRVEEPAPVAAAAAADAGEAGGANGSGASGANGAAPPGGGLDAELGQAFDNAFGDAPVPAAASGGGGADLGMTQAMGAEDAARIAAAPAAPAPAPAETEWYVAIGQAQVGPLPLAEVKRKWEAGDVGPDSLVWRPGMGDWQPLTSVSQLAAYLAPIPRVAPQRGEVERPREPAREQPARTPAPVAGQEVSWKPVGASALAALASEEIAAHAAPDAKPAARAAPAAGGARSLVDALPDGGGVDPTGALPLSIKGLETTGEKKIERRSTVASRAEEARHKRSVTRVVVVGLVVVLAVVGAAAAYVMVQMRKLGAVPAGAVATAPAAPPAAPQPPPAPAAPAAAEAAPAAPAAAAPAPPPAAEPPPPAREAAPAPPRRVSKAEPPARREAPRREAPQARAAAPEPAPTPAPPPAKKKDSLLDFDSSDSALDEALGGGSPSGRSVYVPPARAKEALPDKLSPAQINEAVAGRIDALRRCVSEQKARDPEASGVLKLRWVIAGDGSVRDVKTLTGEYASGPFSQCITGVVKGIRFPRSATRGQEVTFPFSF